VSLLETFARKYSIEPSKMLDTLRGTVFKNPKEGPPITNEQLMALILVANQYGLNPITKEIYAFPDKNNGIVPVVGVDGWSRIINTHPEFDGLEFVDGPADAKGMPDWIECVIHRKDRAHPVRAREYMSECRRGTGPWQSHPRRMLRHKSLIQCARLAFGYTGIYDQDEAERIVEGDVRVAPNDAVTELNRRIESRTAPDPLPMGEVIDADQAAGVDAAAASTPVEKPQAAPAPGAGEPPVHKSYAQVRAALEAAKSVDELDEAASMIELVVALDQKKELSVIFRELRAQLAGE
jgi:phage recombination protein Bet